MNFTLQLSDKQVALIQMALQAFAEGTLQDIAQQCQNQASAGSQEVVPTESEPPAPVDDANAGT